MFGAKKRSPDIKPPVQNLKLIQKNTFTQSFFFHIGKKIDESDPTLAWSYNVPIILTNEKNLILKTGAFEACLFSFVGEEFPSQIKIYCDNIAGLANQFGNPTEAIIVLELQQISSRNESGISARDLIYRSVSENEWSLGTLRDLKFRIYVNEETAPVILPTVNTFGIAFKILHIAV